MFITSGYGQTGVITTTCPAPSPALFRIEATGHRTLSVIPLCPFAAQWMAEIGLHALVKATLTYTGGTAFSISEGTPDSMELHFEGRPALSNGRRSGDYSLTQDEEAACRKLVQTMRTAQTRPGKATKPRKRR